MSNHRTYACASHNPKMVESEDDLGNPSNTDLVTTLARRTEIAALPDWLFDEWAVDFPRHWRWIRTHQHCVIEIHDEYGVVEEVSQP